ncbi:MAG: hypothetical protein ACQERD_08930 [Campylobacterota bacterium]
MKKSLITAQILLGSIFLLSGCGGGGGDSSTLANTSSLSKINGVVSDGPIKNARVFLDVNNDGSYNSGEPYNITDDNGKYEISYVLDPGKEYLLIAEGGFDNTLKTVDPKDNPNEDNLKFKMFLNVESQGKTTDTNIVGKTYKKDLTPITFKNHIKSLDKRLNNSIKDDTNNPLKGLIDTAKTDRKEIFKDYILNNQDDMNETIVNVGKIIEFENKEKETDSTKSDLGLSSTSKINIVIDDNKILPTLLQESRTSPAIIGNMVISKDLSPAKTIGECKVHVTRYDNLIEVPNGSLLKNEKLEFENGADITTNSNCNNNIITDTDLLSNYTLNSNQAFYQFNSNSDTWTKVNDKSDLELKPFVIAKEVTTTSKIIDIKDIANDNDTVVIKAKDSSGKEVIIDSIIKTSNSDDINITIPDGYTVSNISVVSKTNQESNDNGSAAKTVEINTSDDGNITLDDSQIEKTFVIKEPLKGTLVKGDSTEDTVGISSLINSKIAFDIIDEYDEENIESNENGIIKTIKYNENSGIVTASFEISKNIKEDIDSYTQESNSKYEGTVIFDKEDKSLKNAKYTQKYTQENSKSGENSLDGLITIKSVDNNFSLLFEKGDFDLYSLEYGNIKGKVKTQKATVAKTNQGVFNTLDTNQTVMTTQIEPVKKDALYPASLVGNWNGTFSDSCIQNNGDMTISFISEYSASWQAQSDNRVYGTELSVSGTKVTLKDSSKIWSVADIGSNSISGTWSDTVNDCNGEFTVSKGAK